MTRRPLPRGCWQAFCWYAAAALLVTTHAPALLAVWFSVCAALYASAYTIEELSNVAA